MHGLLSKAMWLAGVLILLAGGAGCSSDNAASPPLASPQASGPATPDASPQAGSPSRPVSSSPIPTAAPPASAAPTPKPMPSAAAPAKPAPTGSPVASAGPAATPGFSTPEEAEVLIASRAQETITAIQNEDFTKLATLIHPHKGVQFSPYSYIQSSTDVIVQANALATLWANPATTHWGIYDGSGDNIDLTLPNYWAKFVYNANFAAAPQVSYNTLLGKGNMTNNVLGIYPASTYITVEYHFPGIDPQFQGMDWTSLRLIFAYSGGDWYLVAIAHDQHTM